MKLISSILILAVSAIANADLQNSCIWKNEEFLKELVLDQGIHWMKAVNDLHEEGSALTEDYGGVGSCRFVNRALGATPKEVIATFLAGNYDIIPTRAYLKVDSIDTKIVIPYATYTAGTNWIAVQKDFYIHESPMCENQQKQAIDLGQNSGGLRFADMNVKRNVHGGVSMIINGDSPQGNYLGVCHFHIF